MKMIIFIVKLKHEGFQSQWKFSIFFIICCFKLFLSSILPPSACRIHSACILKSRLTNDPGEWCDKFGGVRRTLLTAPGQLRQSRMSDDKSLKAPSLMGQGTKLMKRAGKHIQDRLISTYDSSRKTSSPYHHLNDDQNDDDDEDIFMSNLFCSVFLLIRAFCWIQEKCFFFI